MSCFARRAIRLLSGFLIASMFASVADTTGDPASLTRAARSPERPEATIYFARNDVDLEPDASSMLDPIVDRAWSNLSVRVLVVGFANESRYLEGNLDVAEQRARNIAAYLLARAVYEHQIIVAAVEAPVGDPAGRRCEVEIVGAHR